MLAITQILSTAVPLPIKNIKAHQIVPKEISLKGERNGIKKNLFRDWRFHKDGSLNDDFILNEDAYFGKILITGNNFGCKNSTDPTVWALYDYGFKAIISSKFSNVFKEKALQNGVLPVKISNKFLQILLATTTAKPKTIISINTKNKTVTLEETGQFEKF